jgi:hypothetical protein
MKTNKNRLFTALVLGVVVMILFMGGCKKELSKESENIKKPDLLMSSEGGPGKAKVLRQSPGLKVEMKSKASNRVYPTLKGIEKLTALLKEVNKKKKAEAVTTSSATFSATSYGSWYSCIVDFLDVSGTKDFYLVNENTWVFTYIGSSSEAYATFAINKPSMYGSYRIWIEGGNGDQFSNNVYLGDPYSGVSLVSGILEFTDKNALYTILTRLEQAMEDHSSNFEAPLAYMTDDQLTDHAISVGFDEFLPMKEFEAYFGFYSLRQKSRNRGNCMVSNK